MFRSLAGEDVFKKRVYIGMFKMRREHSGA